jgi:cyclomaltodextrinase / maltogenic alpha-amylase / neopullulanase
LAAKLIIILTLMLQVHLPRPARACVGLTALLFLLVFSAATSSAQTVSDVIRPHAIVAGSTDTLIVSDLFFAPHYDDLSVGNHPSIAGTYERDRNRLILRTDSSFEGLGLLPLYVDGDTIQIPVASRVKERVVFQYVADRPVQTAFVMGSFNDWSRTSTAMVDRGDGTFAASVYLDPGFFPYQFVINGEEFVDPGNPERVPNGFGGFNSVVRVAPRHTEPAFLHIGSYDAERSLIVFYYEGPAAHLSHDDLFILVGNGRIPDHHVSVDGNRIAVRLPDAARTGKTVLRAAVSHRGQVTPLQKLRFFDGQPAGSPDTPWTWSDAIIYSLMVDRFRDGNPANNRPVVHPDLDPRVNYMGGDLAGIKQAINEGYFDSLAVNAIWITPVNQGPEGAFIEFPEPKRHYSGYHGYWPVQPRAVDDRFGTIEDLQELTARGEAHGIRLLLDFVANHVHQDHPFYQQFPEWFAPLELPDGSKNIRQFNEYRLTTWFDDFLPSFDFANEVVIDTMVANAVWWLRNSGAHGYRHDAVKHIPNEFWRALTRSIRTELGGEVFQIGETYGSYDLIGSYVNAGQLDAQFNFNLYDAATSTFLRPGGSFRQLAIELERTHDVYGFAHRMGNLMDNHDKVRFISYADGSVSLDSAGHGEAWDNPPPPSADPEAFRTSELYLAYLASIPGIPVLYYGNEIGMTGGADPDNRRMMRFSEDLSDLERAKLERTRRIMNLRAQHSALRHGDFLTLFVEDDMMVFMRSDLNERIVVSINKGSEDAIVPLAIPDIYGASSLIDLESGEHFAADGALHIPARSWRMMVVR